MVHYEKHVRIFTAVVIRLFTYHGLLTGSRWWSTSSGVSNAKDLFHLRYLLFPFDLYWSGSLYIYIHDFSAHARFKLPPYSTRHGSFEVLISDQCVHSRGL